MSEPTLDSLVHDLLVLCVRDGITRRKLDEAIRTETSRLRTGKEDIELLMGNYFGSFKLSVLFGVWMIRQGGHQVRDETVSQLLSHYEIGRPFSRDEYKSPHFLLEEKIREQSRKSRPMLASYVRQWAKETGRKIEDAVMEAVQHGGYFVYLPAHAMWEIIEHNNHEAIRY